MDNQISVSMVSFSNGFGNWFDTHTRFQFQFHFQFYLFIRTKNKVIGIGNLGSNVIIFFCTNKTHSNTTHTRKESVIHIKPIWMNIICTSSSHLMPMLKFHSFIKWDINTNHFNPNRMMNNKNLRSSFKMVLITLTIRQLFDQSIYIVWS